MTALPAAAATVIADGMTFVINAGEAAAISYSGSSTSVAIPRLVTGSTSPIRTYSVTTIGNNAFAGKSLTSVSIPSSVTSIGDSAFAQNKLTSVTIPNSVTSMSSYAFADNMLTSVMGPNSLNGVASYAFSDNNLTSLPLPNSIGIIGEFAFAGNLLSTVALPDSVYKIGTGAFSGTRLTSVTIPDSVASIGPEAFESTPPISMILLAGNAPALTHQVGLYDAFSNGVAQTVYYNADASGYLLDVGGRWNGYRAMALKLAASVGGTAVKQDEKIVVEGGVAFPGATVTATLGGSVIGSATATNAGKFAFEATIPAGAALGSHTMTLSSPFAGTALQQQIPIVVTEGDAAAPGTPDPGAQTPVGQCTTKPYRDVKTTSKYCASIQWMKGSGVMPAGKTMFKPKQHLTRGSAAQFLYCMTHNSAAPKCTYRMFKDMGKRARFCKFARWATINDIIKPSKTMKFKPKRAVTRAQLADMLYRLDHAGTTAPKCRVQPFKDVKKKHRYCGAMTCSVDKGLISPIGKKGVTFKPA